MTARRTEARPPAAHLAWAVLLGVALAGPALAGTSQGKPIRLAEPRDLAAAVAAIEAATGAKAEPLEGAAGDIPSSEGRSFALDGKTAVRLLAGSHAPFRKAGLYLFRLERAFGMGGDKDRVGVLVAADRSAVIRRIGTAGPRSGVTAGRIVEWLDALEKEEPFDLLEVGVDYVAGRFHRQPKDPARIASQSADLAPALAAGDRGKMLRLLADEIRTNRTLYLFW